VYTEHGNFGFGRQMRWRERVKERAKALFVRNVAVLTANSRFTAALSHRRYATSIDRTRILHNGLDLERFRVRVDKQRLRAKQDISQDAFCVGTVCRLAKFKRVDRLVASFASLLEIHPNSLLLIAGDGPERPALEKQIKDLGLDCSVRLLGTHSDVATLLAVLDCFVLPSRTEPFGISAVEAMASGLPVLAFSDGGGVLEILEQVDERLIATNEEILAKRLAMLAADPDLRQTLGCKGAEVADNFSIERMAESMTTIYNEVINN
jgi:glycosyltransferase involved in cell wall biosynthesis